MLAFMPLSPTLPFKACPTMASSTMSIAILPSAPRTYCQNAAVTSFGKTQSPSKKPKLSLNTATVAPVYGKGSTSLRLDTLSTTSPTSRNTFQNTYSPRSQHVSTPNRYTSSPQSLNGADTNEQGLSPTTDDSDDSGPANSSISSSSSSSSSVTSASTVESYPDEIPYNVPDKSLSILCNGPVPHIHCREATERMSPPRKIVSFRTPLTEDIKTRKYILSNIDWDALPSPGVKLPMASLDDLDTQLHKPLASTEQIDKNTNSTHSYSKNSYNPSVDERETLCPVTPVAGKRKRDRNWVWTLGPSGSLEVDQ